MITPTQTKRYGPKTTGAEVVSDLANQARSKAFFITGANTGLGFETARCLASVGAKVYFTCRSQNKVSETAAKLQELVPNADVKGFVMELSSLDSVKSCAEAFLKSGQSLNVLINNAGVMACPLQQTKEGFEFQLLMPVLHAAAASGETARIVNLSSMGHFLFSPPHGISLDDLNGQKKYNPWTRYGESKLANILHAKEITRRYGGCGVIGIAVHPGAILETDLKRNFSASVVGSMVCRLLTSPRALGVVLRSANKNTAQGVSTTLVAALAEGVQPGGYYVDCQLETAAVHPLIDDADLARRLWESSDAAVAPVIGPAGSASESGDAGRDSA